MKKILTRALAAAAFAMCIQGAQAATQVTFNPDDIYENTRSTFKAGKYFSYDYDFNLSAPTSFMGQVYSSSIPALNYGIGSLTLSLLDSIGGVLGSATSPGYVIGSGPGAFSFDMAGVAKSLAPGDYRVTVAGDAFSGGGSYRLTMAVAPVPEPEVWAMLLAGLGLVSWRARQRHQ